LITKNAMAAKATATSMRAGEIFIL
jgi:hypothetical protein